MKYEYPKVTIRRVEDIIELCKHHLENISKTELDLIENQDMTKTDEFYINMFRQTWQNLLNAIEE